MLRSKTTENILYTTGGYAAHGVNGMTREIPLQDMYVMFHYTYYGYYFRNRNRSHQKIK